MSFHVEFHPPGMPGTGQKVCVVGGGGGGLTVNLALVGVAVGYKSHKMALRWSVLEHLVQLLQ